MTLTRGTSGWIWGNIVFGGIVGLAVDAISGSLYKLSPAQVSATMVKTSTSSTSEDGLFVMVVLKADSTWEKIGELSQK